jgi:uncharacterized protein
MKKLENPFLLLGYYGPAYFCNREEELLQLSDHIKNGRNVVLYAWRRLGKSALINRFLQEEEKSENIEAIYIDIMATENTSQAIEAIIEAVCEKYGKTQTGGLNAAFQKLIGSLGVTLSFDSFTGLPNFSIAAHPSQQNEITLNRIGEFLSDKKKQVVIAIDEFQQITSYEEKNVEAIFRQFMQSFPSIRFIFSGSQRNLMTQMFLEKKRPFYKSCQLISLESIPLEKYQPFIEQHFAEAGKKIEPEIIYEIYDWSRGQTYSVQLLCNLLFGANEISQAKLEEIKKSILVQEAPFYSSYQKILTKAQWQVLLAIAREGYAEKVTSKKFLSKHNLAASSTVNSALKTLINNEVVVFEDGKHFVHEVIFGRWLATL